LLASLDAGERRVKMISSSVPVARLRVRDEIAGVVVFYLSDVSSYVTGT